MNEQNQADLLALVEEKLTADTEFQSSLETMSDEEKAQALTSKRTELLNAEYRSAIEYGKNQKIRAEKAEGKTQKPEPTPTPTPEKKDEYQLNYKDTLALTQNSVHIDDVDEVIRFARFNNMSVPDALVDPTLKAILTTRGEERSSALAANKGGGKASTKKVTGTELVQKLSKGDVPEPGSPEAEALYRARRGLN